MKNKCVIIGFEYKDKQKIKGISLDLFYVYKFCKRINMDILVITDIIEDKLGEIRQGFSSNFKLKGQKTEQKYGCDPNVYSFIEDIQLSGEYCHYEYDNFLNTISEHCKNAERLFFYYSGHGITEEKNDYFILPNSLKTPNSSEKNQSTNNQSTNNQLNQNQSNQNESNQNMGDVKMHTSLILENMLKSCDKNVEIFSIIDSCNTSHFNLPYELNMDFSASKYRSTYYKQGGIYQLTTNKPKYFKPNIVCLCSSMFDEISTSTWSGSTFTELFFQCLEIYPKERNIHNVLKEIQYVMKNKQTCRAYASNPTLIYLYPWLFNSKFLKISYSDTGIFIKLQNVQ